MQARKNGDIAKAKGAASKMNAKDQNASRKEALDEIEIDMKYLEGTIGYAIRRAQIAVFADLYKTIGEMSITPTQFSVLSLAADNPGLTQAYIATALGVERPRIVPIIDSLEKRRLAERVTSETDRRAREIHLTKEGHVLLKDLKKRFASHQARMIARLKGSPDNFLDELWNLAKSE
ncbi:MarR family winged helix-turn-helix transcriptional regulator [Herbaspirillum lusitanum]|uniref:MarR family winged helix-turn-helix transcriptional regulator n=1 Tax=Herbaspirillum lusitanum TaxID=213312 RepID=UPI0002E65D22|nr:MarR family transcriptional regulator [Herbaspirillum lusitanum]